MIITFLLIQGLPGQTETSISVAGEVITIDGTDYDLSVIPEGGEGLLEGGPFVGPVKRINSVIHATVIAVMDSTAAPVQASEPPILEVTSGVVELPIIRLEAVT